MNRDCLNSFLKRFGTNAPEALEIFGLVLKAGAKLRIEDKSMLMYNKHGVLMFIIESMEGKTLSIFEALGADLKISLRTNPVVSLM